MVTEKLREEINESKKMRHEFVMRKFAFSTGLLGVGALVTKENLLENIDFAALLYLVPLVAVAFDFYILAEDYRIKRVGEFLKRGQALSQEDKDWEAFCSKHPNKLAAFAYVLVTALYFTGSAIVILQNDPNQVFFYSWAAVIVIFEIFFLWASLSMRNRFKEREELVTSGQ